MNMIRERGVMNVMDSQKTHVHDIPRQCGVKNETDSQKTHAHKMALGASDNAIGYTSRRWGLPIRHCTQGKFSGGCLGVLGKMDDCHCHPCPSFFGLRYIHQGC
jgi:hypothetical protein